MSKFLEIVRLGYMASWRRIKEMTRYKANFLSGLVFSVVWSVAMLLFVPLYSLSDVGSIVGTQNFVSFLLLGFAFQNYMSVALWSASGTLQWELSVGITDYIFASPVSRYWYMVSTSVANALANSIFFIPMFVVALLFTNFTFSVLELMLSLVAVALTVFVLMQIGVLFSTLVLQFKQVSSIFGFLSLAFQMLTGMLIPLQMLPDPLKIASAFFPLTFGIDLSRHHLLHTSLVFPYMFEWFMLLLELLILAAVSLITIKYVERTAKKQGLHFA